jgi:hypothetical protein
MIFAYVLPIERPKTVENGTEKAILFGGVWSPDGKYIAYGVKAEDNATLVVASRSFPALSKTRIVAWGIACTLAAERG